MPVARGEPSENSLSSDADPVKGASKPQRNRNGCSEPQQADQVLARRPILFSGGMVRALLDGSSTQTRRVVKQWQMRPLDNPHYRREALATCPYGQPGDQLWVRETHLSLRGSEEIMYVDDEYYDLCLPTKGQAIDLGWRVRSSIYMPRWASRVTLEITGLRTERLQEIGEAEAITEACSGGHDSIPQCGFSATPREHFRHLWDALNEKRGDGWHVNPWVWVISFAKVSE